ncbi:MAG TPA: branched-chain amino acid ABC transporter permease [Devosiaceae bacterium]
MRNPGSRGGGGARELVGFAAIGLALGLGYLLMPDSLALLTRMIALMLLVMSLDLVTGVGGVATLGQAALYGAGAYAAGIASARLGIGDPLVMLAVGGLAGAGAGLVGGALVLRGEGLARLVLSIAFAQVLHEAASKASGITGGSDGLTGIAIAPLFGLFAFDLWGRTVYWLAGSLLLIVLVILRALVRSPFGLACAAIRINRERAETLGVRTRPILLRLFVVSGLVAGLGGALSAISTRVVGLDSLSFILSADALVMLVIGGTGNIYGALVGTFVYVLAQDRLSALSPFHWIALVGALLIGVVLFVPRGMTGSLGALRYRPGAPGRRLR